MMKQVILFCFLYCCVTARKLEKYNIDHNQISVSGLSAGAYMAIQMHVAYSKLLMGVGVIAGGPYMCARDKFAEAVSTCMLVPELIDVGNLEEGARKLAGVGLIDPVENLKDDRAFFLSGTRDTTVATGVVKAAEEFYEKFIGNLSNILGVYSLKSEHGFPTMNLGGKCDELNRLFINNCSYEASWQILNHIYNGIKKPIDATQSGSVILFDQTEFYAGFEHTGLDDDGYVYVPDRCKDGKIVCRLHLSLHGCLQGKEVIGDRYVTDTGYNDAGAANDVIILYPQVKINALKNPFGCFDWWGFTGGTYATKNGLQMTALRKMVQRLADV